MLLFGQRRLGHESSDPGVIGLVGEVGELLICHLQLVAELAQAVGDLDESALDQ